MICAGEDGVALKSLGPFGFSTSSWEIFTPTGVRSYETELLIPWPYDEIYRWYLSMKICDANGETKKYSNEAAKYNSYWQGYFNAYNQAHMPKQYATHFRL